MIVWGGSRAVGFFGAVVNDGARYSPSTDSWIVTAAAGAPSVRQNHSAVWTGTEMIVWGGNGVSSPRDDGARYLPASDSWAALPTGTTLAPRANHSAAWTA